MALRTVAWIALTFMLTTTAMAERFTPQNDADVIERLPARRTALSQRFEAERGATHATPQDPAALLRFARVAIERGQREGDPRFVGIAEGVIEQASRLKTSALQQEDLAVLRAITVQYNHHFREAISLLDALLASGGGDAQALLTKATIHLVLGEYPEAARACRHVAGSGNVIGAGICAAYTNSFTGGLRPSLEALQRIEHLPGLEGSGLKLWLLGLEAELAERLGDDALAEERYESALKLDPDDIGMRVAYADWLVMHRQSARVLPLLGDAKRVDGAFLRYTRALCEQGQTEECAAARRDVQSRIASARERGDRLHVREEAYASLFLFRQPAEAAQLAAENWSVQREPIDLWLLAAAAHDAGRTDLLATVKAWQEKNSFEDVRLAAFLQGGRHE